jgi:hypothetical protein
MGRFEAMPVGPGGQLLARTDEPVAFTLEEAAAVLAISHPVRPQRWGALTVRAALHDATRAHLTLDREGAAPRVVLDELARAAQERAATQTRPYRPLDPGLWEASAAAYGTWLVESGVWARAATGVDADGEPVVVVYAARYHDLDQAAGLIARELPAVPGRAGRRTAYEALVAATKRRAWPLARGERTVDGADPVALWADALVRLGVFPGAA